MTDDQLLPCGIPRCEHSVCYERNCYLSGEGCPVHQGPKKRIIRHIPEYVHESILVDGKRIYIGDPGLLRELRIRSDEPKTENRELRTEN